MRVAVLLLIASVLAVVSAEYIIDDHDDHDDNDDHDDHDDYDEHDEHDDYDDYDIIPQTRIARSRTTGRGTGTRGTGTRGTRTGTRRRTGTRGRGTGRRTGTRRRRFGCGCPPIPRFGLVRLNGTRVGDVAEYFCLSGFTLVGVDSRICQINGFWSNRRPICRLDQND